MDLDTVKERAGPRQFSPKDDMPEEYRKAATRMIQFHANSEIMGALSRTPVHPTGTEPRPKTRVQREGTGRNRPRATALPRRRIARHQDPRRDARRVGEWGGEVPELLPLPDGELVGDADDRLLRGRRGDAPTGDVEAHELGTLRARHGQGVLRGGLPRQSTARTSCANSPWGRRRNRNSCRRPSRSGGRASSSSSGRPTTRARTTTSPPTSD